MLCLRRWLLAMRKQRPGSSALRKLIQIIGQPCRSQGGRGSLRLYRRRVDLHPGRSQYGPVVRQSHRDRSPQVRRGSGRSRFGRRAGRVSCVEDSRIGRPSHRDRLTPAMIEMARANATAGGREQLVMRKIYETRNARRLFRRAVRPTNRFIQSLVVVSQDIRWVMLMGECGMA